MRRNGIAEDDLNRCTLPRKYTDHVSSMPENFGRPQWDEILQIIPFENDVTGSLLALSRQCEPHTNKMKMSSNKPSSSQSTELSLRKSTGATLTKKSDTSSPEKKKEGALLLILIAVLMTALMKIRFYLSCLKLKPPQNLLAMRKIPLQIRHLSHRLEYP